MNKFIILFLVVTFIAVIDSHSQVLTYEGTPDSLQQWVDQRVVNAENGIKETVKIPLAVRSLSWGCICPDHYIGYSPDVQEGPWIFPTGKKKLPKSDQFGHSLTVTGYFTGKMITKDLRRSKEEPEEWIYTMPEFIVTEWNINTDESETLPPPPKPVR